MTVKELAAQLWLVASGVDRNLEVRVRDAGGEWALYSMEVRRDAQGDAVAVVLSSEAQARSGQ